MKCISGVLNRSLEVKFDVGKVLVFSRDCLSRILCICCRVYFCKQQTSFAVRIQSQISLQVEIGRNLVLSFNHHYLLKKSEVILIAATFSRFETMSDQSGVQSCATLFFGTF